MVYLYRMVRSHPATVTARLTHKDREKLIEICEHRGITINEGVRLGITEVIRGFNRSQSVSPSKSEEKPRTVEKPRSQSVCAGKPAEKPEEKEQPRQTAVSNPREYEDAMKSVRTKSGKYRCPECGRYLKTETGFYQHYERCLEK